MSRKSKFPRDVIVQKLREAEVLAAKGKLQGQIAQALGISVMTYHRWRKSVAQPAGTTLPVPANARIAEMQQDNERLRRLVADLLLENMTLEERLVTFSDQAAATS